METPEPDFIMLGGMKYYISDKVPIEPGIVFCSPIPEDVTFNSKEEFIDYLISHQGIASPSK